MNCSSEDTAEQDVQRITLCIVRPNQPCIGATTLSHVGKWRLQGGFKVLVSWLQGKEGVAIIKRHLGDIQRPDGFEDGLIESRLL